MFNRLRSFALAALLAAAALSIATPALAVENTITVVDVTTAGVAPTTTAANADGSKFRVGSDERVFIRVTNANASTRTLTLEVQRTSARVPGVGVVTIADKVITVPALTGDLLIGPITPAYIDNDGFAHVTYSAVSDVAFAVFRLPAGAN